MCNCKDNVHRLQTVQNTGTDIVLNVTDSANVSNLECFTLYIDRCKNVSDFVTGSPLPVQIVVNGATVKLLNKYAIQIVSNRVPRRAVGAYVKPTTGDAYVILFTTPQCKCNAQ